MTMGTTKRKSLLFNSKVFHAKTQRYSTEPAALENATNSLDSLIHRSFVTLPSRLSKTRAWQDERSRLTLYVRAQQLRQLGNIRPRSAAFNICDQQNALNFVQETLKARAQQ